MSRQPTLAEQKRLIQQWGETGRLLHKIRYEELAAQTPEQSRQAAYDMLQMADHFPPDPKREKSSGLVEMQRLFALWRAR